MRTINIFRLLADLRSGTLERRRHERDRKRCEGDGRARWLMPGTIHDPWRFIDGLTSETIAEVWYDHTRQVYAQWVGRYYPKVGEGGDGRTVMMGAATRQRLMERIERRWRGV